jgi:hypothetical protein
MPMRMSHEMLLQEIQKSKTDFMQATTPKKLNDSSIQETQRSNSQSTMQQVQESLNKEIQNRQFKGITRRRIFSQIRIHIFM